MEPVKDSPMDSKSAQVLEVVSESTMALLSVKMKVQKLGTRMVPKLALKSACSKSWAVNSVNL